jgi:uncharacterized protein YecA (UPF0149 family)
MFGFDLRQAQPICSDLIYDRHRVVILNEWRLANTQPLQDIDPRVVTVPRKKVGRNEPCPCGSGKKYKKCCGLN